MQTVSTIGLDIAKSVFQVHGVDADGQVVTFVPNCAAHHLGYDRSSLFTRRPLDIRPYSSYITILAHVKDMARRHTALWERGRCPRAELQSAPGRLGYQPPGMMTGMGGASLDWDRRRRVTPVQTKSQEAWPEAEPLG